MADDLSFENLPLRTLNELQQLDPSNDEDQGALFEAAVRLRMSVLTVFASGSDEAYSQQLAGRMAQTFSVEHFAKFVEIVDRFRNTYLAQGFERVDRFLISGVCAQMPKEKKQQLKKLKITCL